MELLVTCKRFAENPLRRISMNRERVAFLALFVLLGFATPVLAHHSFVAEFDGTRLVPVKGTLTRVEWANPHMWFYVDVKDENGNVANWGFENTSITFIRRQYPDARKLLVGNIGKEISIVACPSKAVPHVGAAEVLRLADGTIMKIPGGGGGYKGTENEDEVLQNIK